LCLHALRLYFSFVLSAFFLSKPFARRDLPPSHHAQNFFFLYFSRAFLISQKLLPAILKIDFGLIFVEVALLLFRTCDFAREIRCDFFFAGLKKKTHNICCQEKKRLVRVFCDVPDNYRN
jgi:hypothetical protein